VQLYVCVVYVQQLLRPALENAYRQPGKLAHAAAIGAGDTFVYLASPDVPLNFMAAMRRAASRRERICRDSASSMSLEMDSAKMP
jgi:hypothetical protein